jgi:hypothetical protein
LYSSSLAEPREIRQKREDRIHGVLSCFDRMLFRGYLPIMSGWQMAQFFNSSRIRFRELKTFLLQNAERVKRHALYIAEQEGRPHQYLQEKIKKEDLAKQIAERDHIEEGLRQKIYPLSLSGVAALVLAEFEAAGIRDEDIIHRHGIGFAPSHDAK